MKAFFKPHAVPEFFTPAKQQLFTKPNRIAQSVAMAYGRYLTPHPV